MLQSWLERRAFLKNTAPSCMTIKQTCTKANSHMSCPKLPYESQLKLGRLKFIFESVGVDSNSTRHMFKTQVRFCNLRRGQFPLMDVCISPLFTYKNIHKSHTCNKQILLNKIITNKQTSATYHLVYMPVWEHVTAAA